MKLPYHLSLCLTALLGCVCFTSILAAADTTNPLHSTENWTIGHNNTQKTVEPVIDTNNGTLTLTNASWSRGYAIYTFPEAITLSNHADSFTISYDFSISDSNSLLTCTLICDNLAITVGHGAYNDEGRNGLQVGTSTITDGCFYNTQGTHTGGVYVEPIMNHTGGTLANKTFTITTSIFWHEPESQFIVNSTTLYNGLTYYLGYVGLGDSCTLEKLVFSLDGNSVQSASNMIITSEITPIVPEPASSTLSIIAVCGLAVRRRRK